MWKEEVDSKELEVVFTFFLQNENPPKLHNLLITETGENPQKLASAGIRGCLTVSTKLLTGLCRVPCTVKGRGPP